MKKYPKGWHDFIKLCLATQDAKILTQLLDLLLTLEEKENLALRTLIIKELMAGKKTQREIAKELEVSIAKITRGSNAIKLMNDKLLAFLQKTL